MKTRFASLLILLGLTQTLSSFGGTVITGNLPTSTAIVNINARADGSDLLNQALWRSPFSTAGAAQILKLPITAGRYRFRIIDSSDAKALYPSLTGALDSSPWQTFANIVGTGQPVTSIVLISGGSKFFRVNIP